MYRIRRAFWILLAIFAITSCSPRIEYVETERVRVDTFIKLKQQIDSVVKRDSVYLEIEKVADTVFIRKTKYVYRDRIKIATDTVYKSKVDSIPVIVEVEKPLTFKQKAKNYFDALWQVLLGFLVIYLIVVIYKKAKSNNESKV